MAAQGEALPTVPYGLSSVRHHVTTWSVQALDITRAPEIGSCVPISPWTLGNPRFRAAMQARKCRIYFPMLYVFLF